MHIIAEDHEIEMVKQAGLEHCFLRFTNEQAREFIETDAALASRLLSDNSLCDTPQDCKMSIQCVKRLFDLISEKIMPSGEYWPWPRDYYPNYWKVRSQPDDYKQRFVEAFRQSSEKKGFEVLEEFGKELTEVILDQLKCGTDTTHQSGGS